MSFKASENIRINIVFETMKDPASATPKNKLTFVTLDKRFQQ